MKITREVNGVSMVFELSSQEVFNAYEEQEHIWDVAYIEDNFGEDERFNCMSDEERSEAYEDIAWDFRKTVNDMEHPDEWECACDAREEFFKEYTPKNVWITVYKDALGCPGHKDNLTEMLVPVDWLTGVLAQDGITDFEAWLDEYTADSTVDIARMALDESVILKCNIVLGKNKDKKTVESLISDSSERSEKLDSGVECKGKEEFGYGE